MAPINYDEDTEFNEALRKHGIIPKKDTSADRSPSPPPAPPSPTLSELDLDDLDITKDDSVRRDELERALEERREREKATLDKRRFGRIYNIGKTDYTREVTEASAKELPGEPEGWGTGVVCVLFKNGIAESEKLMTILNELAALYPASKFVSIVSTHCIENYPDKNVPTMLVYRAGKLTGQIVGLSAMGGMNATLRDVERMLFAFRGIDFENKVGYGASSSSSQFTSRSDATAPLGKGGSAPGAGRPEKPESEDEEDSEDDQAFVGGGKASGIRRGTKLTQKKDDDSDSDYDL
ncbi:hypothetical protein JCM8547_001122 [Rhodosporidiobolus lusitaniae]